MPQGPYLIVEDGSGHVVKGPTILKFIGAVVSRLTSNTAEITISGGSGFLSALSVTGITANQLLGAVPANAFLLWALIRDPNNSGISLGLGSTLAAVDIAAAAPLGSKGTVTIDPTGFAANWFSHSAPQNIYITGPSGFSTAAVTIDLVYQIGTL